MTIEATGRSVEFAGVAKRYGPVIAVEAVDLTIAPGEFCTLLGPSGSGKTTLLKLVAGFEPVTEGSVHIGGRPMGNVPVAQRNIGMVFQNYALFPHMRVAANIAFPLEMRKVATPERERRVAEAMRLVDLEGYGDRYPRELSGGQQQRVALARALVFKPDLLLMDEPLGALDKNLRQSIQQELRALHRSLGVTIIYVTHDQEEALFLSDRIVVMERGRIAQIGAPEALYSRPANAFVARFLGDCNLLPGRVDTIADGRLHIALAHGGTAEVVNPGGVRTGQEVVVGCRPERVHLSDGISANVIPVVLRDAAFAGAGLKLMLDHASGSMLAHVDGVCGALPPAGTRVGVRFDPAHAFLLPSG